MLKKKRRRYEFFFFSSRRRHTRCLSDWSSDVCSSDLDGADAGWVSRQVARVLKERMGLAAEPRRRQPVPAGADTPGRGVRPAPDAARPDPARPQAAPTSIPMQPTVPALNPAYQDSP